MTAVLPEVFIPNKTTSLVLDSASPLDTPIPLPARVTGVQRIRMTYAGFSPAKVWYFHVIGGGSWISGYDSRSSIYRISEGYPKPYGCLIEEYQDRKKNYDSGIRVTETLTGMGVILDFVFASLISLNPLVIISSLGGSLEGELTIDVETWTFTPQRGMMVTGGVTQGSPPRVEYLKTLKSNILDAGFQVPLARYIGPHLVQIRVELGGFQVDWAEFYLSYGYRDNPYVGLPDPQVNSEIYQTHCCTIVQTSVDTPAIEQNRRYTIFMTGHTFSLLIRPNSIRRDPPLFTMLSAPLGAKTVTISVIKPLAAGWC